jgi:hypothetical protein
MGIFLGIKMKKLIVALLFILLFSNFSFARAQSTFTADARIKVSSTIVANNTTAIAIKTSGGVVYSVDAFSNNTTLAYIKLYNGTNITCGTGTPYARYLIPYGASSSGGGFNVSNINGDAYGAGISMCITTGIADTDTSAPAATSYIVNIHYR